MLNPIPNKLQGNRRIRKNCVSVHKYRRFSKKNKTYDLRYYFCADCGHKILLEQIYGVITECWKCGKAFSFYFMRKLPIFPLCEDCDKNESEKKGRKIIRETRAVEENNIESIDLVLTELGLK